MSKVEEYIRARKNMLKLAKEIELTDSKIGKHQKIKRTVIDKNERSLNESYYSLIISGIFMTIQLLLMQVNVFSFDNSGFIFVFSIGVIFIILSSLYFIYCKLEIDNSKHVISKFYWEENPSNRIKSVYISAEILNEKINELCLKRKKLITIQDTTSKKIASMISNIDTNEIKTYLDTNSESLIYVEDLINEIYDSQDKIEIVKSRLSTKLQELDNVSHKRIINT